MVRTAGEASGLICLLMRDTQKMEQVDGDDFGGSQYVC